MVLREAASAAARATVAVAGMLPLGSRLHTLLRMAAADAAAPFGGRPRPVDADLWARRTLPAVLDMASVSDELSEDDRLRIYAAADAIDDDDRAIRANAWGDVAGLLILLSDAGADEPVRRWARAAAQVVQAQGAGTDPLPRLWFDYGTTGDTLSGVLATAVMAERV